MPISRYFSIPGQRSEFVNKTAAQIPFGSNMRVFLGEHSGSPAHPIVQLGQKVLTGEMIAQGQGEISLDAFSPTSGIIAEVGKARPLHGAVCTYIDIVPDLQDRPHSDITNLTPVDEEMMVSLLKHSGILLKTAPWHPLFPVLQRFQKLEKKQLIVSFMDDGISCANILVLLNEQPELLLVGLDVLRRYTNCSRVTALLNVKLHRQIIPELEKRNVEILPVSDSWPIARPQVGARVVTGVDYFGRDLCFDSDVLHIDGETLFLTGLLIQRKLPFIETRVTVSGYGIARPQVVKCRIGIPVSDLIVQAGGFVGHVGKIILGSLFEGSAIADINVPVTRTLKSIIVLPWKAARKPRITPCICCGRCVDSCPAELEPLYLEEAIRRDESQLFHQLNGHKCIQCGVCSYTCPSGRPLSEKIRAMVLRLKRGKKH